MAWLGNMTMATSYHCPSHSNMLFSGKRRGNW
jgi:hypothetical protein